MMLIPLNELLTIEDLEFCKEKNGSPLLFVELAAVQFDISKRPLRELKSDENPTILQFLTRIEPCD